MDTKRTNSTTAGIQLNFSKNSIQLQIRLDLITAGIQLSEQIQIQLKFKSTTARNQLSEKIQI